MRHKKNPKGSHEDVFTGPNKKYGSDICSMPKSYFEKGLVLVGDLVTRAPEGGLLCEVPTKGCKKCGTSSNKFCYKHTEVVDVIKKKLIKSKKRPYVVANASGTMVMVVSSDAVVETQPIDASAAILEKAAKLHQAFHGVPYDDKDKKPIKKIDIEEPSYLVFFGWLKHIIYDVPKYSERSGVPFIHEAQDRGDDKPKAREKPYVCISPNYDYLVMYGTQFEFTARGIIG
jgi:hypothetical protein